MEEMLEVLFVLIVIGASAVSSAIKAKKKSEAAKARHQAFAPEKASAPAKAEHPYSPVLTSPAQPITASHMAAAGIPAPVITPAVHPHLEPDCETHDVPGSLGVTSLEGKDPCHKEQLTITRTVGAPVQEAPGMTFDWSGESLVKAFVMQEILTRPSASRQAR